MNPKRASDFRSRGSCIRALLQILIGYYSLHYIPHTHPSVITKGWLDTSDFLQLQKKWILIYFKVHIFMHRLLCGPRSCGFWLVRTCIVRVVATVSWCRCIVIMFAFIWSNDSFRVCRSPLDMLSNIASCVRAFVITPANKIWLHQSWSLERNRTCIWTCITGRSEDISKTI